MSWSVHNLSYLSARLDEVRYELEVERANLRGEPTESIQQPTKATWTGDENQSSALQTISARANLEEFEQKLLLICVGMELDARFPRLCADVQGNEEANYPTFSLALRALGGAHWDALAAHSGIRRHRLLSLDQGRLITQSRMHTDERVWQALLGISGVDQKLLRTLEVCTSRGPLVPSHQRIAQTIIDGLQASFSQQIPIIQVCGRSGADQMQIAQTASERMGFQMYRLSASDLPEPGSRFEELLHLWERECLLADVALYVDCHTVAGAAPLRVASLHRLLDLTPGLVFLGDRSRRSLPIRESMVFDVPSPTRAEQNSRWKEMLDAWPPEIRPPGADWTAATAERLMTEFVLDQSGLQGASNQAMGTVIARLRETETFPPADTLREMVEHSLFESCKAQVRPDLDNLAERLTTGLSWSEIILTPKTRSRLRFIEDHVLNRSLVHETWGLSGSDNRGTGTSVLFAGPSGTGKTMAAEVLSGQLGLDLYRIDLSAVVSKYIGETEKNLSRIFDAAERGGVALLFDEADSLFGKRSDVKDARDRHANIEVSYLLQRLETFRGLAILTSNLKDSIDHAFLRRIRYIVDFPFPDAPAREQIWMRMLSRGAPVGDLDYTKLARLNIAGGTIRNIILTGASMAAGDDEADTIEMHHLREAARHEYGKSEHPLPTRLVGDW